MSDPFGDIRGNLTRGYGCLSGEGAEEIEHVHLHPLGKDGAVYGVRCQHCGQPNQIMITWGELVYCAAGALPPKWIYEPARGAMRPEVGCGSCNVVILLLLTPDECRRHLAAGEAAGFIQPGSSQQHIAQIKQQVAQYRR